MFAVSSLVLAPGRLWVRLIFPVWGFVLLLFGDSFGLCCDLRGGVPFSFSCYCFVFLYTVLYSGVVAHGGASGLVLGVCSGASGMLVVFI